MLRPARRLLALIIETISPTRGRVRIAAYEPTPAPIVAALVGAHDRSVDVQTVLDRANLRPIALNCPPRQLDSPCHPPYLPPLVSAAEAQLMRIRNSLKSAKVRDKNCRVVRRHGRVYVINKKNPRMKCRQG